VPSNAAADAALKKIYVQLKGLSDRQLATKISKNLAQQAVSEIQKGFRASRDPYGNAWAPLKHRQGKPLLDSGRLRNSYTAASVTAAGFRIGTNAVYSGTHQFGTARVPMRRIMPIGSLGLGEIWHRAMNATAASILRKHFAKG